MLFTIIVFGAFFFGVVGLVLGQVVFGQLFSNPANGLMIVMMVCSVLIILYGVIIYTIGEEGTQSINKSGYKLIKLRAPLAIILAVFYIAFCLSVHDYSFPLILLYWLRNPLTTMSTTFLGLFLIAAFMFGLTIFSTAGFSADQYVDISYEKVGETDYEISRSAPYIARWQFVLASFLGLLFALVLALTPLAIVGGIYYLIKLIVLLINKILAKNITNKKDFITSSRRKEKVILITSSILSTLLVVMAFLSTNGIFSSINTIKNIKITENNYEEYFKVSLGTKVYYAGSADFYYEDIVIKRTTVNTHYKADTNLSYKISFKYQKFINDVPTSDAPLFYENTIKVETVVEPYEWNTSYRITDYKISDFKGNYTLIYKDTAAKFYLKIINDDLLKVNQNGVYFKNATYVHSLFLRIKTNDGETKDIYIVKQFFSANTYFVSEYFNELKELLLINGFIYNFYS